MARNLAPRTIQCYHCRHRFEVSGRTQSTSCPGCNKAVIVEDIVVKAGKIRGPMNEDRTCGKIIIQKRGRLMGQYVEAGGGMICEGTVEAKEVVSGRPAELGPKAVWHSALKAPHLVMAKGAIVKPSHFEIGGDPLGLSDLPPPDSG